MGKFTPTNEQQLIIDNIAEGRNVAIQAGAGCSKTTTLKMAAEALPRTSILYVAFNKSIATEADETFPINVECRTLHSIAWQNIVRGTKYRFKLKGYIDKKDMPMVVSVLDEVDVSVTEDYYEFVRQIITGYCYSATKDINKYSFGWASCNDDIKNEIYSDTVPAKVFIERLIACVEEFWKSMIDITSKTKIHHDCYLKLYQLSNPLLPYEIIYVDEAQDSNQVVLDIVLQQTCQKVLVGDNFQQLYAWRGATNALASLPEDFSTLTLTTSFRFNSNIANITNQLLSLGKETFRITGKSTSTSLNTTAILVSRNVTLFKHLLEAAMLGRKVYVLGDTKELFSILYSASNLRAKGDKKKRYNKTIQAFNTWEEFLEASKTIGELTKVISILNTFPRVHDNITLIKQYLVNTIEEADVIVATLYKSKGLEFDTVILDEELFYRTKLEKDLLDTCGWLHNDNNLNKLYVACTRARVNLVFPLAAEWLTEGFL